MIGDGTDEPHLRRAREWILAQGGAAHSNVFTRNLLALFGSIPWSGVPVVPVEIMVLPRWFPFHIDKISYWARTVLVPLTVLNALKPKARNPKGVQIDELYVTPPKFVRHWPKGPHQKFPWSHVFGGIDRVLRLFEPAFPKSLRKQAISKAVTFVTERLNGEDGLGAIFPAMVNSVLVYDALGYSRDHPDFRTARGSIEKLLIVKDDEAYCQPCLSPVWDTALTAHALMEAGGAEAESAADRALAWLKPLQILDTVGDWAATRPGIRPGGWAFQYANPYYPDTDDTAVVVMAMDRALGRAAANGDMYREAIARGREWNVGMQSRNGGWGAFDADNDLRILEPDSIFRSRRAARPADGRRHGALRLNAGSARRTTRRGRSARQGHRLPRANAGKGWELVRPLGNELHLWDVVGALRAECGWPRPRL